MPQDDLSALKQYAGVKGQQLIRKCLQSTDILTFGKVITNVRSSQKLVKLVARKGLRPYNAAVKTAYGDGTQRDWSGRDLTPRAIMKILSFNPEEYRDTYLGTDLEPNAKEVPFAQWVWESEMLSLADELNRVAYMNKYRGDTASYNAASGYSVGQYVVFANMIYKCVTNAAVGESPATTPNKWSDETNLSIFDGWGTLIAADILSGKIASSNVVSTGAISGGTAVAQIEAIYHAMSPEVKAMGGRFAVSVDIFEKYVSDYRSKFPFSTQFGQQNGSGPVTIHGSNGKWSIEPCTWLGGSGRIIATIANNLVIGTNQASDMNSIGSMIENVHGYDAKVQFLMAMQYQDTDCLFVNDVA